MGYRPNRVLADRAYDARSLREELAERRIKAVIPPNPTRKHPYRYDKIAYRGRNVIERMFCRLKDFRRIATRYDKRADIFPLNRPLGRNPHLVAQLSPDPRAVFPKIEVVLPERFSARGRKRSQAVVGLPPRALTLPLPKSARP